MLGAVCGCFLGIVCSFLGTVVGAFFSPLVQMTEHRLQYAWSFGDDGIIVGAIFGTISGVATVTTENLIAPIFTIAISGLLFGGIAWFIVRGLYERPIGVVLGSLCSGLGGALGGYLSLRLF
jgi:hypothetical protein